MRRSQANKYLSSELTCEPQTSEERSEMLHTSSMRVSPSSFVLFVLSLHKSARLAIQQLATVWTVTLAAILREARAQLSAFAPRLRERNEPKPKQHSSSSSSTSPLESVEYSTTLSVSKSSADILHISPVFPGCLSIKTLRRFLAAFAQRCTCFSR